MVGCNHSDVDGGTSNNPATNLDNSFDGAGEQTRLLVVHGLRLKGPSPVPELASVFDLDLDLVEAELKLCREAGLATVRMSDGRPTTWTLTVEGRTVGEKLLAEELALLSTRRSLSATAQVGELYRRFLPLNRALLEVCTQWQVRQAEPLELNDHSDVAYDAAVVDRLQKIHGEAITICDQLEALLSRFNRYRDGFNYALARIQSGAVEWFTKPTISSYHTLWFELHEDLLATLGLDRAAETARGHTQSPDRQPSSE